MNRSLKTFGLALLAALAIAVVVAPAASADFGLKNLSVAFEEEDGTPFVEAGGHPYALTTELEVETREDPKYGPVPDGAIKDLRIGMPAGMVGNPTAVPPCSSADFAHLVNGGPSCSAASAVGVAEVNVSLGSDPPETYTVAVYNIEAPLGAAAKIGFVVLNVPATAELRVNPEPPYNVVATLSNLPQAAGFFGSRVEIWGNPASPVHDEDRGECATNPVGSCPVSLPEKPFLTAPRSCGPLTANFEANSWENQGTTRAYEVPLAFPMSGCANLKFDPKVSSQPTTRQTSSASGLSFDIDIDDPGLTSVTGTAKSDIRKTVVTLPEGMTVNPSIAEGLATCSEADLAREGAFSEPGEGCPQASKVGEVEVETPLLEGKLLEGSIYAATQDQNPFKSMIALYMVIQDPELGIIVKLPGRVDLDPKTGQLVTTFGEPPYEVPQFPFSHFRFRFREGPRAPLITPSRCGTYGATAAMNPWANPQTTYVATPSFTIDQGVGGGPCPSSGPSPFAPSFLAGSQSNAGGTYSPFSLRLTRSDGEQGITRFDAVLPPGLTGKLAGIEKCPEAVIAAAKQKSGREELAFPSCPPGSKVGTTLAGAGVGSSLTYVPGSLYLGGPVGDAPLSIVAITPAVAGPFDAGTVVVREALTLNPVTAQVEVDGASSDPIPHILKGIPLSLRDLRVITDRPEFTRNPTSCSEKESRATLFGSGSDPLNVADDVPVQLASRFQASSCASLKFKPRLSIKLKGGTRRAAYPALQATVRPRPGDANIKKAVVTLPSSAFLAQEHIVTVCTRVQFAADNCPKGAIYGFATARTPLLDEPLKGPVYLRSSSNPLPDLVADLRGLVDIELVGRIDSLNGRIRSNFESVPDQPVSSFTLKMRGGKKSLVTNSVNLCSQRSRAISKMKAHNGRVSITRPVVRAVGCRS